MQIGRDELAIQLLINRGEIMILSVVFKLSKAPKCILFWEVLPEKPRFGRKMS